MAEVENIRIIRSESGLEIIDSTEEPRGDVIYSHDVALIEGTWLRPSQGDLKHADTTKRGEKIIVDEKLGGVPTEEPRGDVIYSHDVALIEGTWLRPSQGDLKHADITKRGEKIIVDEKLGGVPLKGAEEKLKAHKRGKWIEPRITPQKGLIPCAWCGGLFKPKRKDQKYCRPNCRKMYSQKQVRDKKRKIKNFKPHYGKNGELEVLIQNDGFKQITYIPALYSTDKEKALNYVNTHIEERFRPEISEQLKLFFG